MVIPGPKHQDHTLPCSWITEFGPSRLEDEDRQEDLGIHGLVCLDPFVKLSIVDMLKCTIHTRFMFGFWFS